jgi:hypothetical protein
MSSPLPLQVHPHAPAAPRDFTATLITPEHDLYTHFRAQHTPQYQGVTTMNILALAWVNPTKRDDDSPLTAQMIGMSIVSEVNEDGTLTPLTTVVGSGCTALVDAPPHNGSYTYQVACVDKDGHIGVAVKALAPVVIKRSWPGDATGGGEEEDAPPPVVEADTTPSPALEAPAPVAALAGPTRRGEIIDTAGKKIGEEPKHQQHGKRHEKRAR